nr:extensin-2-like [Penaeus vannamei]
MIRYLLHQQYPHRVVASSRPLVYQKSESPSLGYNHALLPSPAPSYKAQPPPLTVPLHQHNQDFPHHHRFPVDTLREPRHQRRRKFRFPMRRRRRNRFLASRFDRFRNPHLPADTLHPTVQPKVPIIHLTTEPVPHGGRSKYQLQDSEEDDYTVIHVNTHHEEHNNHPPTHHPVEPKHDTPPIHKIHGYLPSSSPHYKGNDNNPVLKSHPVSHPSPHPYKGPDHPHPLQQTHISHHLTVKHDSPHKNYSAPTTKYHEDPHHITSYHPPHTYTTKEPHETIPEHHLTILSQHDHLTSEPHHSVVSKSHYKADIHSVHSPVAPESDFKSVTYEPVTAAPNHPVTPKTHHTPLSHTAHYRVTAKSYYKSVTQTPTRQVTPTSYYKPATHSPVTPKSHFEPVTYSHHPPVTPKSHFEPTHIPSPPTTHSPVTPKSHYEPATHSPVTSKSHFEPVTYSHHPPVTPVSYHEPVTPKSHYEPATHSPITPKDHFEPVKYFDHPPITPVSHYEPVTYSPVAPVSHYDPETHFPVTPKPHYTPETYPSVTPKSHYEPVTHSTHPPVTPKVQYEPVTPYYESEHHLPASHPSYLGNDDNPFVLIQDFHKSRQKEHAGYSVPNEQPHHEDHLVHHYNEKANLPSIGEVHHPLPHFPHTTNSPIVHYHTTHPPSVPEHVTQIFPHESYLHEHPEPQLHHLTEPSPPSTPKTSTSFVHFTTPRPVSQLDLHPITEDHPLPHLPPGICPGSYEVTLPPGVAVTPKSDYGLQDPTKIHSAVPAVSHSPPPAPYPVPTSKPAPNAPLPYESHSISPELQHLLLSYPSLYPYPPYYFSVQNVVTFSPFSLSSERGGGPRHSVSQVPPLFHKFFQDRYRIYEYPWRDILQ